MTGNNPVDRSKICIKRHILTDKQGIPLSAAISSANTYDIKAVKGVIDNSVPNQPFESSFSKKKTRRQNRQQRLHLCLDRAYNSKSTENEIINRGYVPHIPHKRKRGQSKLVRQMNYQTAKDKRCIVERTNFWHNRFRKILQDMKRRLRITLVWCNFHAVSLPKER